MGYPETLVAYVTALAITISKSLSPSDTALLAAVLTQLGDTLTTLTDAKDR